MAKGRFDNPVVAAMAGVKDFFDKQELSDKVNEQLRADGKTILITGSNSGLGYGLAMDLASRGARLILTCRRLHRETENKIKGLSGNAEVEVRHLDLSDVDSIHQFVNGLKNDGIKLDVVVLNAGVALPNARRTASGQEEMFMVNYLSNVMLGELLISEALLSSSSEALPRMIYVSSDSHRGSSAVDYEEFGRYLDYGPSKGISYYSYYKLLLNTYATELSRRVNRQDNSIAVNIICPGPVNSGIIKEAPWLLRSVLGAIFSVVFRSPAKAALPLSYMALHTDLEGKTNRYMHMFNPKRMDSKVYDEDEGQRLWEASHSLWKSIDPLALSESNGSFKF